jgi:hypothetical protein
MSDFQDETRSEPAELAVEEQEEPGMTDDEIDALEADPDQNPEPEPEPEAFSEAVGEKRAKSLEGLRKHVTRRLGEIFGDDAVGLVECPVCTYWSMPGWVPPVEMPEEVKATILHLVGQHAPTDYRKDNYSRVCDECGGLGETATGSLVQGQAYLPCIPCYARGWIAVGPERAGGLRAVQNGPGLTLTHAVEPAAVQYAPPPADTPEISELKRAGYVVIPPMAPIGGKG